MSDNEGTATVSAEPHVCDEGNALKFREWLATRGGLLIWKSVDLGNLGASWTTPALTAEGLPYPKPTWQAESTPSRRITDPAEVVVTTAREYKRFHVGVRAGCGLALVVTDAGSRRIRKEVARAEEATGKPAWYVFDYGSEQNAVILVEDSRVPLSEWNPGEDA